MSLAPKFGHRPTDHDRRLHYQHTLWMIRRALCVHRRFGAEGLFGEFRLGGLYLPGQGHMFANLRQSSVASVELWPLYQYVRTKASYDDDGPRNEQMACYRFRFVDHDATIQRNK